MYADNNGSSVCSTFSVFRLLRLYHLISLMLCIDRINNTILNSCTIDIVITDNPSGLYIL